MASPTRYVKGDYKTTCDVCGRRYLASQLRQRWDGLMTCKDDYEERHPQDFVRARVDNLSVPWSRPEPSNTFVAADYAGAIPGYFTPGMAIPAVAKIPDLIPPSTFTV